MSTVSENGDEGTCVRWMADNDVIIVNFEAILAPMAKKTMGKYLFSCYLSKQCFSLCGRLHTCTNALLSYNAMVEPAQLAPSVCPFDVPHALYHSKKRPA